MKLSTPCVHAYRGRVAAFALALAAIPAPTTAQEPASAPAIAPVQALSWSRSNAEDLLRTVESASAEGLDPAEYGLNALRLAIETNDKVSIDHIATAAALKLAADYRFGRTPTADRVDWHLGDKPNPGALMPLVRSAVAEGKVGAVIRNLLPKNSEYQALRAALADVPPADAARRDRLRVNLDRWRWMPRDFGDSHVFVNIPQYRVKLVRNGAVVAEHDAIVGKPDSPTPAFATRIEGVVLNPSWAVPPSLKAKKLAFVRKNPSAARRMGYSVKYGPNGVSIFQKPGPANALGQMKLVMPNEWDIYLHDTSEPELFAKGKRALSAGCVRVDRPLELVNELLEGSEWDSTRVDETLASGRQSRAHLTQTLPVYVAYMTAAVGPTGQVDLLPDPYGRDGRVAKALSTRTALAVGGRVQTAALN